MTISVNAVIANARFQVGVKETGLNNTPYGRALDAAGVDVHDDGSPYPLGRSGAEWCGTFCRWLLWVADIPVPQGLYLYTVSNDYGWCASHGCVIPRDGDVRPGDLVMYFGSQFPGWHIGIVVGVLPDGRIQTVEGNVSNQVGEYTRDRSQVAGFYRPAYPLDPPAPPTPEPLPTEDEMPNIQYRVKPFEGVTTLAPGAWLSGQLLDAVKAGVPAFVESDFHPMALASQLHHAGLTESALSYFGAERLTDGQRTQLAALGIKAPS